MTTQTIDLKTLLDVPDRHRRPMTNDESEMFIRCAMVDQNGPGETARALRERVGIAPVVLRILIDRVAAAAPETSLHLAPIVFLARFCDDPGTCVLWAFYAVKRTQSLRRALTMRDLAVDFGNGFPTEEGYGAAWDAQKGVRHGIAGVDNLLDTRAPWLPTAESAAA